MSQRLRVLFIEDSEPDEELLTLQLERGGFEVEHLRVDTAQSLKQALASKQWDLILSDFNMPRLTGLQALGIVRSVNPDVPFIVVSGAIGEETAVELMRAGAQDFIQKGNLLRLVPAIQRELSESESRSRRQQAEKRQRELEVRFEVMANAIPQLAWMAEPDGSIFWYNQRWYEYTGTTFEQMKGWGWKSVHHPDHVNRVVETMSRTLKTGESWEDTFPIRSRVGEWRWFLSRSVPIRDADGKVIRWFGTSTDITDQLRIQNELKEKETFLRQALEARDHFISLASHELKTPITSLNLQTQYLERLIQRNHCDLIIKKLPDYLALSRRQLARVSNLVEDMLDVSKISTGQLKVVPVEADFSRAAQAVISNFEFEAKTRGCELKLNSPPSLPGRWDIRRLEQVLMNLVSNALKYGCNGGIEMNVIPLNRRVRVEVVDHGPGIAKKDQLRVFGRFERAISENEVSGLGLGLFICRKIIEAHHGKIWVESELGQGSRFIFEVPGLDGEKGLGQRHAG
jgi:PAS domain S-box-containing protein